METKDLRWIYKELGDLQKKAPHGFGNSVRELREKVKEAIRTNPTVNK